MSRHLSGFHNRRGYDLDFSSSHAYWRDATIHSTAYEYLQMCHRERIARPPYKLKIWQWEAFAGQSSAPMLPRIWNLIGYNGYNTWRNLGYNFLYGLQINTAVSILRFLTPDIIIGDCKNNTAEFINTVSHEMAHASHFSAVGSSFWAKYITYIITYKGYGYDGAKNSGICAVGEMWGYAMGNILTDEKYNQYLKKEGFSFWFKPQAIEVILEKKTLTKRQVYDAVIRSKSREELRYNLMKMYPNKTQEIDEIFKP